MVAYHSRPRPCIDVKPIDYPIPASAHDPMHVQHKYWSRKPHNVVRAHIEACSEHGEIILDPFCGSGVTASQALITGRKIVATDLNPVADFITRNTITRGDIGAIIDVFTSIKAKLERPINVLYQTRCPACLGLDTSTVCVHWKVHHPIKVIFTCNACTRGEGRKKPRKSMKIPDSEDLALLDRITNTDVPYWVPDAEIPAGMVFDQARRVVSTFSNLFTRRNLIALSMLLDAINNLPELDQDTRALKSLFLFSFSSIVHLCSIMTPIRPSRPYSSFWATNSYWIPPKFMESNVWEKFESAIMGPQGLVAGKRDANKKLPKKIAFVSSFDELLQTEAPCALVQVQDATSIDELVPRDSIDYIFTDPPYAGSIPYQELSSLWATWLRLDGQIDFGKEILIDPARGKTIQGYGRDLHNFFVKANRILKPGKYMTFTYHNLDMAVRREILRSCVRAGFDLETVLYQPPPRTSPAHTLRPFNSAVGDYIVHFKNGTIPRPVVAPEKITASIEADVIDTITRILFDRGEPCPYTTLLNSLDVELAKKPWFLSVDVDPRNVLKKNTGTVFFKVTERIGTKAGCSWWLTQPSIASMCAERGVPAPTPVTGQAIAYVKDILATSPAMAKVDLEKALVTRFRGSMALGNIELKKILGMLDKVPR